MTVWIGATLGTALAVVTGVQMVRSSRARGQWILSICLVGLVPAVWFGGDLLLAALQPNTAGRGAQATAFVPEPNAASAAVNPPNLSEAQYTTSTSCRKCHAEYYESWYHTYHRTMTREATPENVKGAFDGQPKEIAGQPVTFLQKGNRFFMETVDPQWEKSVLAAGQDPAAQEKPPTRVFPIDRVVGSHVAQVYLSLGPDNLPESRRRGVYFTLPYEYSLLDQRWHTSAGSFMQPEPGELWSQASIWNQNCILCHNVKPRPNQVSVYPQAYQSRPAELGIACESCHGPGEYHVAANRDPLRRIELAQSAHPDPTIINPNKLDAVASSAICGRCHSKLGIKNTEVARVAQQNGEDPYTAGDPLERWYVLPMPDRTEAMPRGNIFWPDGTPLSVGVEYQGLLLSPCYEHGHGERQMSCLSCHAMHKSEPIDQLAAGMRGNQACSSCHESIQANLAEHTHHHPSSSGSLCYNCHMPNVVYGLLGVHRSHRVISPNATTSAQTGLPNACNLCHLDQTLAWTAENLTQWYGQEMPALNDDDHTVASSLVMLLRGDAVERAVAANAFWRSASDEIEPSAEQPAGEKKDHARFAPDELQWSVPFLKVALDDPYAAVRLQAHRALQALGADAGDRYFYLDLPSERRAAADEILEQWARSQREGLATIPGAVPMSREGVLDANVVGDLLQRRDNRDISIAE